jgi:predicted amidohydrolase
MKDFRIALVQHNCYVGHKSENLDSTISWIKKAKSEGADLVCFPETNITGHAGHPSVIKGAEALPGGPSVDILVKLAMDLKIFICAGIVEDDMGITYNTQFMAGPEGYIGKQRKIHLSLDEYFYFRGGTQIKVFDLPFARIGIIICYDNLFPEISRCMALKGAELLLCPHAARHAAGNWIEWSTDKNYRKNIVRQQKEDFTKLHSCRSFDNGCYVAVCNMMGQSARDIEGVVANHAGGCMVFNPKGNIIRESTTEDFVEEMVIADLTGKEVADRRAEGNFNLKIRKPELFGIIAQPTD